MAEAVVLKKTRRQAVVKAVGTGTFHANLASLLVDVRANSNANGVVTQTFNQPIAECTITDILFSVDGNATVTRGGTTILTLTDGQTEFEFSQKHGFVLNEQANANIQINFGSSNGTVILGLTKGPGFEEPDLQHLQDFQRP
jgi:hypothetical protein